MLNTKQRAQLRAMANPLAVTLIIGKEGVTDAVERELDALLESHELVKGKVLESAMLTPRTVSEALCEANIKLNFRHGGGVFLKDFLAVLKKFQIPTVGLF